MAMPVLLCFAALSVAGLAFGDTNDFNLHLLSNPEAKCLDGTPGECVPAALALALALHCAH